MVLLGKDCNDRSFLALLEGAKGSDNSLFTRYIKLTSARETLSKQQVRTLLASESALNRTLISHIEEPKTVIRDKILECNMLNSVYAIRQEHLYGVDIVNGIQGARHV
ncbi:hypothetical protein LIER_20486 [Lithospermum erythrorhizon]|uniref:Uncharacterized protein n=1 Tax=Lithospermum erythrorhizon TaxID=34254 RepID=A0AAV3QLP7_LITER